jgi:4a-hydroxytetrahydrobiopterin dehydratase
MARPTKLETQDVDAWLSSHEGWARDGDAIAKRFTFPDFSAALGFTVRVGLAAEKRDHHPDILLAWGKATVLWTTHDVAGPPTADGAKAKGGITKLDLELAEASDALVK